MGVAIGDMPFIALYAACCSCGVLILPLKCSWHSLVVLEQDLVQNQTYVKKSVKDAFSPF